MSVKSILASKGNLYVKKVKEISEEIEEMKIRKAVLEMVGSELLELAEETEDEDGEKTERLQEFRRRVGEMVKGAGWGDDAVLDYIADLVEMIGKPELAHTGCEPELAADDDEDDDPIPPTRPFPHIGKQPDPDDADGHGSLEAAQARIAHVKRGGDIAEMRRELDSK